MPTTYYSAQKAIEISLGVRGIAADAEDADFVSMIDGFIRTAERESYFLPEHDKRFALILEAYELTA